MAGYISEFFGYAATDATLTSIKAAASNRCPFLGSYCTKLLSRTKEYSGVCAIRQKTEGSPTVICCPIRLYAENHKLLYDISNMAFGRKMNLYAGRLAVEKAKCEKGAVAVFGKGWGGELRLPKRKGTGSYFVDWVLARLDGRGELAEITAIEVQTIDTTGNYQNARIALLNGRKLVADTVGLNWENVSKRIIPQIIYKGQVLQREDLCKSGLFFVAPRPVFERVIERLGGREKLPEFPAQPASVHFVSYDLIADFEQTDGKIAPIGMVDQHNTTVYKIQEAFSSVSLPEGNIYRDAIIRSLYG